MRWGSCPLKQYCFMGKNTESRTRLFSEYRKRSSLVDKFFLMQSWSSCTTSPSASLCSTANSNLNKTSHLPHSAEDELLSFLFQGSSLDAVADSLWVFFYCYILTNFMAHFVCFQITLFSFFSTINYWVCFSFHKMEESGDWSCSMLYNLVLCVPALWGGSQIKHSIWTLTIY